MTGQAEDNLEYWLRLHQLPPHFPSLNRSDAPPDFEQPEPFLRDGGAELKRIMDQVLGSFRSMIVLPPGQGTSTLLEVMSKRLKAGEVRVFDLLVRIDVGLLADTDDMSGDLEAVIRRDIFRQLVMQSWIRALMGTRRQKLMVLFDATADKPLLDLEYGLWRGDAAAETQLGAVADRYTGRLAELVRALHGELGISVTLAFDFPYQASEDLVFEVFREIKWFDETEKGENFPPAALRETYFLTRRQANLAKTVWTVNFQEFAIRPYSQAEVFQILSHHYRPTMGGQRYPLATVLSGAFLSRVWEENKPLVTMSQELKTEILAALDCDRGAVPYTLQPADQR